MNLKYTIQDVRNYLLLIENVNNKDFKINTKDLSDFRISFAICCDQIFTEIEAEKALITLERAERFIPFIENTARIEANKYISKRKIRFQVFQKHGKFCLKCGSGHRIALDHILSVAKGGSNSINNLQPLCCICNSQKGTKLIDYR